jgi:iron complex outermembrane receptor protein
MKKISALILLLTIYSLAYSQSQSKISGVVTNTKSKPIAGVTIMLLNTNYSDITNEQGEFGFDNVPAGKYTFHVSNAAYAETNQLVAISGKNQSVSIRLRESNNQLDVVVVTAQKIEEAAQDVPISISTLTAKQVEDYRLWSLKDITAIVPNLYSAGPGDNRNVTGIRGVVTTSYDPAVATYIDGVNQFSLDTYIPQLFDVDRIEVLRGPQGTLYGRNAMGGVVNVITRQPTNQTTGFAELDFGNYAEQRYSFGIRTPLIKNKLYLGVAGLYSGFDGFYTNQFNNSKFDKQHYFLGNYYLKFLANQKLSFVLNVKNYGNRNNGAFPLAGSSAAALSNPFVLNQNAITEMVDNIFNASLTANYTGRSFNFTSNSSYQENYRYYTLPIDGDFSPLDAVSLINNYGDKWNKVKVFAQEFRLSSPVSSVSPFKWTTGVYGFYRDEPKKVGTHFGKDAKAVGSPISNFTSINTNIERNDGAAAFGQVVYSINSKWDITAGLRYDFEHKTEEVKGEFQADGKNAITTHPDTSSHANFKAFTPKLSISYHLADENNLYATYSRGFRSGGISQLSSAPSQPPLYAYQPEFSNNYEIGSKNSFLNNRVRLNITVFYTLIDNAQVPTLILPDAITVTKNAGKLNSKGAEAEFAATILKGLAVDYNFGYTHARYTDLIVPAKGSVLNLEGNHQVYTPDFTSMIALQYTYELGGRQGARLIARGEWRSLGNQYFDLANHIEQKAYSLFNTRLGISEKKFEAFLWASNIINKKYIDYAYDFGASHLGSPRTYGITLRTNF